MKVVILEDTKVRSDFIAKIYRNNLTKNIVVTDNPYDVIREIKNGGVSVMFLDFDLGDTTGRINGGIVSDALRNNPEYIPEIVVIHSHNVIGAKRMKQDIPSANVIPFSNDAIENFIETHCKKQTY